MERNYQDSTYSLITIKEMNDLLVQCHSLPQISCLEAFNSSFAIWSDNSEAVINCQQYLEPYFKVNRSDNQQPAVRTYLKSIGSEESDLLLRVAKKYKDDTPAQMFNLLNFEDDVLFTSSLTSSLILIWSSIRKNIFRLVDLKVPILYIFDATNDPQISQFTLIRLIRNLSRYRLEHSTHTSLHAAAVSLDGVGALITGQRKAGKTTLLTSLLTYTNAAYVSNDCVSLNEELDVVGWPYSSGVRPGTVRCNVLLSRYFQNLERDPYPFNNDLREKYTDVNQKKQEDLLTSFRLPPSEFCSIFQTQIIPTVPLGLIVAPQYDLDVQGPQVRYLSEEEALCFLQSQILDEPFYDPWWEPLRTSIPEQIYGKISRTIPVVEIRQNEMQQRETCETIRCLLHIPLKR